MTPQWSGILTHTWNSCLPEVTVALEEELEYDFSLEDLVQTRVSHGRRTRERQIRAIQVLVCNDL